MTLTVQLASYGSSLPCVQQCGLDFEVNELQMTEGVGASYDQGE